MDFNINFPNLDNFQQIDNRIEIISVSLRKFKSIGFETKNIRKSVNLIIKGIENFIILRFVEKDNLNISFKNIKKYINDIFSLTEKNKYLSREI